MHLPKCKSSFAPPSFEPDHGATGGFNGDSTRYKRSNGLVEIHIFSYFAPIHRIVFCRGYSILFSDKGFVSACVESSILMGSEGQ